MTLNSNPPWLHLLNALHREWRMAEILKDHDPDPYLESQLRAKGTWPPPPDRFSHKEISRRAH